MKKLMSVEDVILKINNGEKLILAGDEDLLDKLPAGNWIAGTIPYFMDVDGGTYSKEKIFVNSAPDFVTDFSIAVYDEHTLPNIAADEFENGYSMIIIPAYSNCHIAFAENSHKYENIFNSPLVGWISGIDVEDTGKVLPKVYNGKDCKSYTDKSVVMHLQLPTDKAALIDIINLFEQGDGDTITFESNGFTATSCFVNGKKQNLATYLKEKNIDIKLPLVADYYGAMINAAFHKVDTNNETVYFYAPVFAGVEYKIAKPLSSYVNQFTSKINELNIEPVFTCNCLLNYLYSELEGKKTGTLTGPITYGEIAYQLLNQTLVYLTIVDL